MSVRQRRSYFAFVVVVGVFVSMLAVAGVNHVTEERASAGLSAKHTICHRTSATTNPYRRITVSINAIYNGSSGGFKSAKHPIHNDYPYMDDDIDGDGLLNDEAAYSGLLAAASDVDGDTISNATDNDFNGVGTITRDGSNNITSIRVRPTDNVFRSGWSYPANEKKWGDIIPPYQNNWDSLNYGADGQSIFSGATAGCARMSTLQYIQGEAAENRTLFQIVTDLEEQGASEDLALRQALGGSFLTWYNNTPGATISTFQNAVTAANPSATTLAAGSVLTTSAQLRASVSPRGVNSTYYFQLATSSAGVASANRDNSGMKVNGANGTTSNSTSSVTVTLDKTGLTNGTTYYYRIIGVSTLTDPDSANDTVESVAEGAIESFVMGSVSATTLPESNVGNTTATLNGNVSPNLTATTLYFQYGTSNSLPTPAVGDPSLVNANMNVGGSPGSSSSSASTVLVDMPVTGLTAATTYYYRIVVLHSGSQFVIGELEEFTTTGGPTVATGSAASVTTSSATLQGSVTPNSTNVNIFFQWASTVGGVSTATESNNGMNVGGTSGTSSNAAGQVSVDLPITGLSPGTTYYFRIVARNAANNSLVYQGGVATFTTVAVPTVATGNASSVTASAATLEGTVTPNSINVNIFFQWANSAGGVANATESNTGMNVGGTSGTSSNAAGQVNVDLPITGLSANVTYHFRIVARDAANNNLVYQGAIATFTTPAAQNNNQVVVTAPTTTVAKSGPPAKTSGGGNGGPPATDPRTNDDEPIENNVNVQVGPNLPGGGGGGGGSIRIAPTGNDPGLELLDANIEDPEYELEITRSGTDYNKPQTWVDDGFGDECWKIEPGGSSYVLPTPPVPPSGKAGAVYSAVKVKAGSLTSDDPNFQVNTLFLDPAPGSMVWPDSNKDGAYNPGGRTGDKEISHVILCVKFGGVSSPSTTRAPSTTAAPGATTTTRAPSTTVAPGVTTTTRAPSTTPAPGATTTTRAPSTTGAPATTAAPGASTTSAPGTTAAPGATTAPPAIPTTSVPDTTGEIQVDIRRRMNIPSTSTSVADGPRNRRITLTVTNGFKQSRLVLDVDLNRFVLSGGNVPLPQLPKTGSDSDQPIQMALAAVAFGAFLVVVRRRLRKI